MANIITRAGKGAPLSWNEADANFTNLNTNKLEVSNNLSDVSNPTAAKNNLGLGNVDNTSDINKPISAATQAALNGKVDTSSLSASSGSSLVGFIQSGTGAVATNVQAKLREWVSVTDFGADPTGAGSSTSAILAAIATGKTVYFPDGIYRTGKITITQNTNLIGSGKYKATLLLDNNVNDHLLYMPGDYKLSVFDLGLNGNYQNNPNLSPNYPCCVLVPTGSLHIENCYIVGARGSAINTGNVDFNFDITKYAHDCFIINNIIDQKGSAEQLGDCMRIFRLKRGVIKGNIATGGLSGLRSCYYCDHLIIQGNTINESWGDVGVTVALSTDLVIDGNICNGHFSHGFEIDSVYRTVVSNNTGKANLKFGILLGPFGPPNGGNFKGYMDGVLVQYPDVPISKDVVCSGNVVSENGQQGIVAIDQSRCLVTGNYISNNATANLGPTEEFGMFISGGSFGNDDVTLIGNVFNNIGLQKASVTQSSLSFATKSLGNWHGSTKQFQYPVRGTARNNLMPDSTLRSTTYLNGSLNTGVLVEDTSSRTGYARQITDSSGSGDVLLEAIIPNVPAATPKLVVIRLRNVDTMTSINSYVNLYQGSTFKYTSASRTSTPGGNGWIELTAFIPDSQKSYAYDNIRIGIQTTVPLTGKVNIESIDVFTNTEI